MILRKVILNGHNVVNRVKPQIGGVWSEEDEQTLLLAEELGRRQQHTRQLIRKNLLKVLSDRQKHLLIYNPFPNQKNGQIASIGLIRRVYSIPIRRFAGDLPLAILKRIKETNDKFNERRIWMPATPSSIKQYVSNNLAVDPILVGCWYDPTVPIADYCLHQCRSIHEQHCYSSAGSKFVVGCSNMQTKIAPYCALLGCWGNDLEEIDLTVTKHCGK